MTRLIIVLVWASAAADQFPFSFFSSLLSPGLPSSLTPSGSVLQPPPPPHPAHRLALSSHNPDRLKNHALTTLVPLPQLPFSTSTKGEEFPTQSQTTLESAEKPQFVFGKQKKAKEQDAKLKSSLDMETTTSSPFLSPPTTIKFTLDDVSKFLKPQHLSPQLGIKSVGELHEDDTTSITREPLTEDLLERDEEVKSTSSTPTEPSEKLFIVESREGEQSSTSPQASSSLTITERTLPIVEDVDENFKPSLSFPFLEHSTVEPENLLTLDETRKLAVASFLQSHPIHYIESDSNIFPIKPFKVKSANSTSDFTVHKAQGERHLSKTPVPKIIFFGEEDESSEEIAQIEKTFSEENKKIEKVAQSEKPPSEEYKSSENVFQTEKPLSEEEDGSERVAQTAKPLSARKTLHFDQEFLSLLKNHNTREKNKDSKVESSSELNPLWFSDQSEGEAVGAWLLKGGARAPLASTLPGVVAAARTPPQKTMGGVFMASLRGLTSTTTRTVRSTTPSDLLGEGPQVVSVGEVGEVPHDSMVSSAPPLSAALKHGVQSLNVSTWVSGCPKLYGKVQLNCATDTDAVANTAMVSNAC